MTKQTEIRNCLGGSPAEACGFWLRSLTLAVVLATCGSGAILGQTPQEGTKPAQTAKPANQVAEKKPPAEPQEKVIAGYLIHQDVELGGRIVVDKEGSEAMWATLVNQSTGLRVLNQSIDMHSLNPSKTPLFDTLSSSSAGYGGDPNDFTYLRVSKGRWYDFAGSFRRDRNYFDYNLIVNPLLGPTALVPAPSTLHIFNTVRRNTDTMLTILPISRVSFRAGFNLGTNEGPTYSSVHSGGDIQVLQWFRNSLDTWTGGMDVKLAKRTTLSYDQFFGYYKGDSSFQLAGNDFKLPDGTPVSLGTTLLSTATCGTGANKTPPVVNGVANPYCSGTIFQNQTAPTRTSFPTEQLRFASRYWERVYMNGRVTYSGNVSNVNSFYEAFNGLVTRTFNRQEIDTGGLPDGRLAHNKRVNINADYGTEVEVTKYLSVSDTFNYWDFRVPGSNSVVTQLWSGTSSTHNLSMLTPISTLTPTTSTSANYAFINQENISNTLLATATIIPQLKVTGGWRFNNRNITDPGDDLTWHQNWLLLGGVLQPSHAFRLNVNYELMNSASANSQTPSNTYTREAPNTLYHIRARAIVIPAKWINLAVAANDFTATNDDPLVNHHEHSRSISLGTEILPTETFSVDLNFSYDKAYSVTDLCYIYLSTPAPPGATNAGTCVPTPSNPSATSNMFLGNGYYNAPTTFFSGAINYRPTRYLRLAGGGMINAVDGATEQLNPYLVPGALQSTIVSPYADVQFNIAKQWIWHGNWTHQGYGESSPAGPAPREFHGEIVTLGVRWTF
jgi:hypothetical protein